VHGTDIDIGFASYITDSTYSYKATHYTSYLGNHWSDYTGKDTNGERRDYRSI